jgi:hypothetical protein
MTQHKKYRCFIKVDACFSRDNDLPFNKNDELIWYHHMSELPNSNECGFTLNEFYALFIDKIIEHKICDSKGTFF